MKELIKKYAILVILAFIVSKLGLAIIMTVWPDLMTVKVSDVETLTYGTAYLEYGITYLINILFIVFLYKEMKKLDFKSLPVLIVTFFSNLIGVLFFLIISAHKILNSQKNLK